MITIVNLLVLVVKILIDIAIILDLCIYIMILLGLNLWFVLTKGYKKYVQALFSFLEHRRISKFIRPSTDGGVR